jgi:hypothetical protein
LKSRNCFLFVVSVVMFGLCGIPARGSLVSYTFTGLMNENFSQSQTFVFGTVPINAPFWTTFTYDDSQPTPNGATSVATYSLTSISVTIGSDTATGTGGNLSVYDKVGGYVDDFIDASSASVTGTLGGINPTQLQVVLQNTSGGVLPGPGIPGPGLTFSQFTPGNATFVELDGNPNLVARGEINASVPEPGSLLLAAVACVGGLAFRARRRSRWILATIPLAILGTVPQFARAANYSWNGGSGNWNTVFDWSVGGTPVTTYPLAGSNVYITDSDNLYRTVQYNVEAGELASLTINQTGGATNLLQLSNGTLEADTATVGTGGFIGGYGTFEGDSSLSYSSLSNSGTIYAYGGAGQPLYINFPSITNRGTIYAEGIGQNLYIYSSSSISSITNSGTIEAYSNGSAYIEQCRIDNSGGNISAYGGSVTLNSTVVSGGTLNSYGGTYITLEGTGTELDGYSHGGVYISPGSNVQVQSSSPVTLAGLFYNDGTISDYATAPLQIGDAKTLYADLAGSGSLSIGSTTIQGRTGEENLYNEVDHTINVYGNASISGLWLYNYGTLNVSSSNATMSNAQTLLFNYGSIDVSAGSTFTLQNTGGPLYQFQGTTTVNGTLSSTDGFFLEGGTLTGGGTLEANLNQTGGTLNPGDAPALFTINGAYDLSGTSPYSPNGGTLDIEIGGYTPDTEFSVLDVNGTATLDGNLNLTLVNGFVPQVGDTFTILNSQGDSGTFTATTSNDPDMSYTVIYGSNYAQVMITAVPEPATAGLIGVCAAAVLSRRRRAGVSRGW